MKIEINKLKLNSNNPRLIKDFRFKKLVNSIKEFPEMLEKRPVVVDENYIILGGNMRYRAAKELGIKKIDVIVVKDWTEEQKKEFTIKDNVGFGDWDWDLLANDWKNNKLNEWGLEVWEDKEIDLDEFFSEKEEEEEKDFTIILKYNKDKFKEVKDILNSKKGTKEEIIYNLLIK